MQRLRTSRAATYATDRGRKTSPSALRKYRLRGQDDPGERGPPWDRAPNGDCVYSVVGLDAWVDEYLRSLKPAQQADPPAHLRQRASA
jgi:hypothetical protein